MKEIFGRLAYRLSSRSFRAKLFFSYVLVPLAGNVAFVAVASFAAPAFFEDRNAGGQGALAETLGDPVLYFLAGGLVVAVTAAAISFLAAYRITTPIHRILSATERFSAGRCGERVPVQADDEIGALARGFNAMATALEEGERQRREFISDVSHELPTPLSTLQGYLEGLVDGVVEPDEEAWALMYSETERMRRLVDDLSQLSRAEAGQLSLDISPTLPARIVRLAIDGMLPLFSAKGVRLESGVPETLPYVLADADRLVQVLTNLLGNALRHTPAEGRVTVRAEAWGGEVLFAVRDTGVGITSEHLPRIFERFYRVEKSRSRSEARGGSGVGLAVCRALVGAMGGGIRAESAGSGEGATLLFTLPAAKPEAATSDS